MKRRSEAAAVSPDSDPSRPTPEAHKRAPMPAPPTLPLSRRPSDARRRGRVLLFLIVTVAVFTAAALAYLSFPSAAPTPSPSASSTVRADADCCRGIEGLELWGPAVKWGSNHRLPSAAACCASCKAMCPHPEDDACRCDSWVFCGDERRCKDRLGEVSPSVSNSQFPFFIYPSVSSARCLLLHHRSSTLGLLLVCFQIRIRSLPSKGLSFLSFCILKI